MGCFDCGAVEMECEDYPEHCDYSTGNCVCNDYNTLAPTTQAPVSYTHLTLPTKRIV